MVISEEEISAHYLALQNVPSWKTAGNTSGYRYKHVVTGATYAPFVTDEHFLKIWDIASKNTPLDIYRGYELWSLGKQAGDVDGSILEVGIGQGGAGLILAASVRDQKNKKIYLLDAFVGLKKNNALDADDVEVQGVNARVDHVHNLLASEWIGNVEILREVPFKNVANKTSEKIALLHINTQQDCREIIEWAMPRLVVGTTLIFSDYGFNIAEGIAIFCNELKHDLRFRFIHNLNGHAIFVYLGELKARRASLSTTLLGLGMAGKTKLFWIFLITTVLVIMGMASLSFSGALSTG